MNKPAASNPEKRHHTKPILLDRAREMRRLPAKAEELLWSHLRNRKLGGFKFRRQQPVGPYVADFYCSDCDLIVELDGDTHDGRETYDEARSKWLEEQGYRVIRFLNDDVYKHRDAVLEAILRACQTVH